MAITDYSILIDGYKFVIGCFACPEQYDVFDDVGNQVAYCRLRHGTFTVECPDVGGDLVYSSSSMDGDGTFHELERSHYLREAAFFILEWCINQKFNALENQET